MRAKKQAIAALKSIKSIMKKRCKVCGYRYTFVIVRVTVSGAHSWQIQVKCHCQTETFKLTD